MQLFYTLNYNCIFDSDFATYAEISHPVNLNMTCLFTNTTIETTVYGMWLDPDKSVAPHVLSVSA